MVFAPLAEKFIVDDMKLKRMGVDLLGSFGVCDILREYGWDPEDLSASESLDRKLIAMGNITGNVFNLFYGFDSPYHNADHNQKKHIYYGNAAPNGLECLGTEINYYFQGLLFRVIKFGWFRTVTVCATWKKASRHGSLTSLCSEFSLVKVPGVTLWQPRVHPDRGQTGFGFCANWRGVSGSRVRRFRGRCRNGVRHPRLRWRPCRRPVARS